MAVYSFSFTDATEVTATHNLDDSSPLWVLYTVDGNGFFPDPDSPTILDNNNVHFDFGSTPVTGNGRIISILDTVAPGSAATFTTIQACKNFMDLTSSGSEVDEGLAIQINATSVEMQSYTDRSIVETAHLDERHNGCGQSSLALDHYPVITSSGVTLRLDEGSEVAPADYVVDGASGVIQLKNSSFPTSRYDNVGVDYVSGYADGVPADLNQATVKQVAYEWRYRGDRDDISLASTTVVGVYVDVYRTDRWAPGVVEVLNRYKRGRV